MINQNQIKKVSILRVNVPYFLIRYLLRNREQKRKNITHKPQIVGGCVTNDANHISGPSRTGEGLYKGLQKVIAGIDLHEISFINAHGTATPYNDEMEAIAFERAGLQNIPVNSYKAYFGHTLGAAGGVEVVVCLLALRHGLIPGGVGTRTLDPQLRSHYVRDN